MGNLHRMMVRAAAGRPGGSSYADEVLADSPVGFWLFDEIVGGVFEDDVASNHGTVDGATVVSNGPGSDLSSSASFNGVTDHVDVGRSDLLVQATAATYEIWISPDSAGTPDGGNYIYNAGPNGFGTGERDWDGGNDGVRFRTEDSTDQPRMLTNGGYYPQFPSPDFLYDGTWYHLVFTFDGGTAARFYVDGVEVWSDLSPPAALGTLTEHYLSFGMIFAWSDGILPEYYHGRIAGAAFYDTVLSPARITAHYDAGVA